MAQVFKRIYENIDEAGISISPIKLAEVAGVQKELATEYLKNELCYTIRQNHRI